MGGKKTKKHTVSPTQAVDELSEIDEPVAVLVQQTEEAHSQQVRLGAVGPGEKLLEETFELLHVDAVLLQVRQTGVVALCWVAAAAPVTAGQMLRLDWQDACEELVGREATPRDRCCCLQICFVYVESHLK